MTVAFGKLLFCLLIPAAVCSGAATERVIMRGFDKDNWVLNPTVAQISADGKTLNVDTQGSSQVWNWVLKSKALRPGRSYVANFRYRVENPDMQRGYFYMLCRPLSVPDNNYSDMVQEMFGISAEYVPAEVRFYSGVLAKDPAFQIHTNGRIRGQITDFVLAECEPDEYFAATPDAKPWTGDLGKLPTGSEEFEVQLPSGKGMTVEAAEFGFSSDSPDNVPALNRALEHCRKVGAARLKLPAGTFRMVTTPINMEKLNDFELDGNGAKLIFLRKNQASNSFYIADNSRLAIRNLSIDWDWENDPLASIVKLIKKTPQYVDFEFVDYRNFPRRDLRVALLSECDPQRKFGVEERIMRMFEFYAGMPKPHTEWISGNVLRMFLPPFSRFYEGQYFMMHHYYYDGVGFRMHSNRHLTFENINIYSNKGHLFVVDGEQQYWQFRHVNVVPPKGDPRRVLAVTADIMHIASSRGFLKVENCEFSLSADDFINAHDRAAFCQKTGPDTVMARLSSDSNRASYHVGDEVEFRNDDYSPSGFTAKIKSLGAVDAKPGTYRFTFDKAVPEPLGKARGFVMFNRRYGTRNIIVRNNDFHDCRNRGVLVLADNVTIKNNRFRNMGIGGISIETGYTFHLWSEGYGVSNVLVRNNVFDTVNPMGARKAGWERDISIAVYLKNDPSSECTDYPILSNILFEGNTFRNSSGLIAYISSAGNVIFRNNTFENLKPRRFPAPYRAGFYVTHADNVKIVNNRWIASPYVPNPGVYAEPGTVKGLVTGGNIVVPKTAP